ncbi:MAG: hypothetical protein JWO31_3336 [Phycisphaerales bacterium]|nr:hypothetical protein [Phycisphaerales bacterium]
MSNMPCRPFNLARAARTRRSGLSMVELLISLGITSLLLTATSMAFVASSASVQANADFSKAAHTARVSLGQVEAEIRRADAVSCDALGTYVDIVRPPGSAEPNEISRRYKYDAATARLTLQVTYGTGAGTVYQLAGKIKAATFGPAVVGTDADGLAAVQRVPISITVAVGKQAVTLTGTSGPRRALDK